jgi:hypothetical protein
LIPNTQGRFDSSVSRDRADAGRQRHEQAGACLSMSKRAKRRRQFRKERPSWNRCVSNDDDERIMPDELKTWIESVEANLIPVLGSDQRFADNQKLVRSFRQKVAAWRNGTTGTCLPHEL